MIKLQSRDYDILLGLRFGIVSEYDLIDEMFKATLIDEAPEELQEFNTNRSVNANRELAIRNEQLWVAIQQIFKGAAGCQNTVLKKELVQIARMEGKHLGLKFVSKIKCLEEPIQLAKVQAIFKECVDLKAKDKGLKNKRQRCRKVMKRLMEAKLVKKLDRLSRGGSKRYYHLTKLGKLFVQETMHELRMPEQEVVAYNWHAMHAEHDSMVSKVGKTIYAFQNKQGYEVSTFLTEAQMKGESMKAQHDFALKWGVKRSGIKFYPDLFVTLMLPLRERKFLIEIDNATHSINKVLGKAQSTIPILIICPHDQRFHQLARGFKSLGCKAPVYFTIISEFKKGGVFESRYWDLQRECSVKLSKSEGDL